MSRHGKSRALTPGARAAQAAEQALEDARCEKAFIEMLGTFLAAEARPEHVAARAILAAFTCGIVLVSEAAACAAALGTAVRAGDAAYAFFSGHLGRRRCTKLNPIARVVQRSIGTAVFTAGDAIKVFVDWLGTLGPDDFKDPSDGRTVRLALVERGARSFWSKRLPRLLANDATAVLTLKPLRPQALARHVTGLPLVRGASSASGLFAACASLLTSAGASESSTVMRQVEVIMTSGDGTRLASLRAHQLQLLEPLLDEAIDDVLAMLVLLVAAGICDRGTVQTERPSHSASARYIRELVHMFAAAPVVAAQLHRLEPAARRAAYLELLAHALDKADGRAALTNADMHLCDAIGCDPAPPLQGAKDAAPRRPPRFLTTAERAQVVSLAVSLAPTPELQAVVRAVGEVAVSKPTRPGDMRDARYEDCEIKKARVVLNLRRRPNLKAPKTATAEGPSEFFEPGPVAALMALKALRKSQAAVDGESLWGRDIDESRRLYARACALIDQSCKAVSGDNFESFYSLRHGVVSDAVLEALLLPDAAQAQAALKRASRRANHRDVRTTVEHYFHLGPEVTFVHSQRAIGDLLTTSIAATWSGRNPHALDQRVSRSDAGRAQTLWAAISKAAPFGSLKSITDVHPCAPSVFDPKKVRLAIEDVAFSTVCTNLRFENQRPVWITVEAEAISTTDWARTLVAARTRYARHFEDAIRPATTRQHKLRGIAQRLRRYGDTADVRKATALWRGCAARGFLDVSDPVRLSAWLKFLADGGVPVSRLVLRLEPSMVPKLEVLNAVFSVATGLVPLVESVPAGKGRPPAYLQICSKDLKPNESPPPASVSMAGFNALMLAACMREDLADAAPMEPRDGEARA